MLGQLRRRGRALSARTSHELRDRLVQPFCRIPVRRMPTRSQLAQPSAFHGARDGFDLRHRAVVIVFGPNW